jgi:hypothetical protein
MSAPALDDSELMASPGAVKPRDTQSEKVGQETGCRLSTQEGTRDGKHVVKV